MMGGDRMTEKDLVDLIEAEEKRLKLHDPEFMQRHREIMETADRIRQENKKRLCQTGTLTEAGNP
jgi:hypothetical protein